MEKLNNNGKLDVNAIRLYKNTLLEDIKSSNGIVGFAIGDAKLHYGYFEIQMIIIQLYLKL